MNEIFSPSLHKHRPLSAFSTVPNYDFFGDSIVMTIRVRDIGGGHHGVEINTADGYWYKWEINLTQHDVQGMNDTVHRYLNDLANYLAKMRGGKLWQPEERLKELTYNLAFQGLRIYKRLFDSNQREGEIAKIFERFPSGIINICSESFWLPWDFLYPVDLKNPYDVNNFLGMRYIIQRSLKPGLQAEPPLSTKSNIHFGLICNDLLKAVREKEIPFFRSLQHSGIISLTVLRSLDPLIKQAEFEELQKFFSNNFHVTHFACHGASSSLPEREMESWIEISDRYQITTEDIKVYSLQLINHPLVFINACDVGEVSPLHGASFSKELLDSGARGIISSECAIPDEIGYDFVVKFYQGLLMGLSLGEALLIARKHLSEEMGNPMGLGYAIYAPTMLKLY